MREEYAAAAFDPKHDDCTMIVVSIQFPAREGFQFDMRYYLHEHLPLCRRCWGADGPTSIRVLRGDGDPARMAFGVLTLLTFDSPERLERVRQNEYADQLLADIVNFTNVHPIIQINEQVL